MKTHALALLSLMVAGGALAQDTDAAAAKAKAEATAKDKVAVSTENIEKLRTEKPKMRGWDLGMKIGASGSLLQNENFVGQTDGLTMQFGGVLSGNADLVTGNHSWRNSLVLEHAQLKTPNIERFVKSSDILELKSLYLYRIPKIDWLGPFARFRLFTQVFPGEIVRGDNVTVKQTNADGTVVERQVPSQSPIELTTIFEPLVLEQSAGVFVEPFTEKTFTAGARLGLGAQEIFTQGGFATADDANTPELELAQLATVVSAGLEAEVNAKGVVVKDFLSWNALLGSYYPVLISNNRGLEGLDLLHLTVGAGVSLKLNKWVSIDYNLRILKQPFVLNDFQVQNAVLISTGFDLFRSTIKERDGAAEEPAAEEPAAEEPKAEPKAEEAKAEDAEEPAAEEPAEEPAAEEPAEEPAADPEPAPEGEEG